MRIFRAGGSSGTEPFCGPWSVDQPSRRGPGHAGFLAGGRESTSERASGQRQRNLRTLLHRRRQRGVVQGGGSRHAPWRRLSSGPGVAPRGRMRARVHPGDGPHMKAGPWCGVVADAAARVIRGVTDGLKEGQEPPPVSPDAPLRQASHLKVNFRQPEGRCPEAETPQVQACGVVFSASRTHTQRQERRAEADGLQVRTSAGEFRGAFAVTGTNDSARQHASRGLAASLVPRSARRVAVSVS